MSPLPPEQYILDLQGNKTAVILSLDRYHQLLPPNDLDPESQQYLSELLAQENLTYPQLLKKLIHQYRQTQPLPPQPSSRPTLTQRRGGHPQHLLQNAPPDLSQRETRKAIVAQHIHDRIPLP